MKLNNLIDLLRLRADRQGCKPLYTFLGDGEVETAHLTFGQLDHYARAIGVHLQQLGMAGERALLNFPPGLDFISAFFGCVYAGVVAVPVPLVSHPRKFSRVQKILDDAGAKVILTTEPLLTKLKGNIGEESRGQPLAWLATNTLSGACVDHWHYPIVKSETLAYLQYTSGSTGNPKGVMITHGNVLHNLAYLERGFDYSSESVSVSWLPHFHDMGLVLGILQPLYEGCPGVLLSPLSFVQRPIQWLRAISQYQGTHSGGPNFAYDLCVRKIPHEERKTLDLKSWQVAYNGAEPIHHDTLLRFTKTFEPNGFRWKTFCPAYGLAESTLKVSNTDTAEEPVFTHVQMTDLDHYQVVEPKDIDKSARTIVSCGRVDFGMKVVIVNCETLHPCPNNRIGEIWVSGPSIAKGYWKRAQETQQTFNAFLEDGKEGPFLRTGDLGFFQGEELFVTGRLKDLIIIRGSNYYPQDIECTVEGSHASLRHGCGIAFSVEKDGEEKLVVVQELKRRRSDENVHDIFRAIRQSVAQALDLHIFTVVFVKVHSIPRTSSGKIQRRKCREAFVSNQLNVIAESILEPSDIEGDDSTLSREVLLKSNTKEAVAEIWREVLRMDVLGIEENFFDLGGHSLLVTQVLSRVKHVFHIELPVRCVFENPTVEDFAARITEAQQERRGVPDAPIVPLPRENELPLSYSQERMWFLNQLEQGGTAYTMPIAARLAGPLQIEVLEACINEICWRHEVLRTMVEVKEGRPIPTTHHFESTPLLCVDLQEIPEHERELAFQRRAIQEIQQPFDLASGPLFRVTLFRFHDTVHVLLVTMHHIISDAWSLSVFFQELEALYPAFSVGHPSPLPKLAVQYADFAHWQREWLRGEVLDTQLAYWTRHLANASFILNLPILERTRLVLKRVLSRIGSVVSGVFGWSSIPSS